MDDRNMSDPWAKQRSVLPRLSAEQRLGGLSKSRAVRLKRAAFKQRICDKDIAFSDALAEALSDEDLSRMRVADFIQAVPGVGPIKAQKMMQRFRIADNRRIRGLGPRQRECLIEWLG